MHAAKGWWLATEGRAVAAAETADRVAAAASDTTVSPERPFRLARLALAIVVPIIVYASLRPFHGWRDTGRHPFAYLVRTAQLGSPFDAILNIAGYVILSFCLVLALYPRLRGARAVALGAVAPALCSLLVEAAQTYLPGRYASAVDVATNSLGAVLGALLAVYITPWLRDHRGGRHLRERWFVAGHRMEVGLLVLLAWLVAVFAQRTLLFGVGDFRGNLQVPVDTQVAGLVYVLTEVFVVGASLVVACLVLRLVLAEGAVRRRWFALLLVAALAARVVAQLAFWPPAALWLWVTPGAVLGALGGLVVASALRRLSRRNTVFVALVLLAAGLGVVNLAPPDPAVWLLRGSPREGILIGLVLVARYASKAWPFAAFAYLLWLLHEGAANPRAGASGARQAR
jgi:VanZ family protein